MEKKSQALKNLKRKELSSNKLIWILKEKKKKSREMTRNRRKRNLPCL